MLLSGDELRVWLGAGILAETQTKYITKKPFSKHRKNTFKNKTEVGGGGANCWTDTVNGVVGDIS